MATQEEMAEWLYDGAMALRQGNKERALELLMQVVEAEEENEAAWLWLSGAVDELEDQQIALENVLAINPNNTAAQQGLELVMQQKQQRDGG